MCRRVTAPGRFRDLADVGLDAGGVPVCGHDRPARHHVFQRSAVDVEAMSPAARRKIRAGVDQSAVDERSRTHAGAEGDGRPARGGRAAGTDPLAEQERFRVVDEPDAGRRRVKPGEQSGPDVDPGQRLELADRVEASDAVLVVERIGHAHAPHRPRRRPGSRAASSQGVEQRARRRVRVERHPDHGSGDPPGLGVDQAGADVRSTDVEAPASAPKTIRQAGTARRDHTFGFSGGRHRPRGSPDARPRWRRSRSSLRPASGRTSGASSNRRSRPTRS